MGRLGRFSEERITYGQAYVPSWVHRHTGGLGDGARLGTAGFATGAVSRRALSNATIVNAARLDNESVLRRTLSNATLVDGARIDNNAVTNPRLGTGSWRGWTAATVKYMIQVQHTKVRDNATLDTVNVGGATSGLAAIWGGMMMPALATVGVSGTAFTFTGATLFVPAGMATTGGLVNFLLWGR